MTVREAFKEFASELEIDEPTVKEAKRLHEEARAALEDELTGCRRTFLSGSYPRNTRLAPLDDIDIIAVVDSTAPWNDDPSAALAEVGEIVCKVFSGSRYELGRHAAKVRDIESTIDDVHLDVVVARETGDGTILEISEREPTNGWIECNPEAHAEKLSRTNAEWHGRVVPVIKMIKHWNRCEPNEERRLPSFLVEAIALHAFSGSGSLDTPEMVHRYFDFAAEKIKTPTTSPAVPNGFVDGDMEDSRRQDLSQRLRRAATHAQEALDIEPDDDAGAHEIWYRLFADPFPKPDAEARKAELAAHLRANPAASIAGGTITTATHGRSSVPGRAYGQES
ncbi:MAG TPA: hypothetical protein VNJ28_00060 [Candidatus Limnocylindrales bacterium]|jgi:hypothetical protein|nr:hypothetical protein [Candidatus Limnocylindrales bacterium]